MRSSDSQHPDLSTDTLPASQSDSNSTGQLAEIGTADAPLPAPAVPDAGDDPWATTEPVVLPVESIPHARYIQQYELIRELGRGGMGVVHLARDLRLGRLVAIKLLTRPGSHQERFLAEARATARCRHENIVVIHDAGVHDGQPYLVFEYLRGQTLRQWMEARRGGAVDVREPSGSSSQPSAPLTPRRVAEIIVPVVRALACAHDMGIIHRDLKPANVMLTEEGVTKVLDFGVAKIGAARDDALDDARASGEPLGLTALGARLGTLPYMSPEQLAGEPVDHRTDIWAIGIILYELVAGAHPLAPLSPARLQTIADVSLAMPSAREHLHAPDPLGDIIDRCLIKHREHRTATAWELLHQLQSLLPVQRPNALDHQRNPFAGLAAFQESDADRFFGRDRDIDHIVTELRSRPFVAVVGPSGVGKSSLIRAGIIPALKRSGEGWDAFVMRPGRAPVAALAGVLAQMQSTDRTGEGELELRLDSASTSVTESLTQRLRKEPGYLGARLRARAASRLRRILIFVDQFEELWTLSIPSDERAAFLACLGAVADDPASPLRVIVSMRSDFFDRLAEDRHLRSEISRGLVLLPPVGREGLREALLRPVEACEFDFESTALVDGMVDALDATPGALPLLQFTAARLWELRDTRRRLLTEDSHRQIGGVGGALARHAEETLARMAPAHQVLVREMFRQLVTADGTRASLSRHELCQTLASSDANQVIEDLVLARLLVASEGDIGEDRVEVVHETLLSSWPRLVAWQHEDAESARLRDQLRAATRQWIERGRSRGLLWRGDALLEYRVWRTRYMGSLTDSEHEFARASLVEEARGRRFRLLMVAAAFAVLCAGLVIVLQQRDRADAAAQRATVERDRAEALATESRQRLIALYLEQGRQRLAEGDPLRAFPYLAEARKSGEGGTAVRFLLARTMQALDGQRLVLREHRGPVFDARFSPDGTRIATASSDKTARIWDADSGALLHTLAGFDAEVWRVRFSPDGRRLVTAAWDNTVKVWDVASGALVWTGWHDGRVVAAIFSHDGSLVATASGDETARVWNAADGRLLQTLTGHTAAVGAVAFSSDDVHLVTGGEDGLASVWNTATGVQLASSEDHGAPLVAVVVSPDGARVATLAWNGRMRVFAPGGRTPRAGIDFAGQQGESRNLAFSPDGQRMVMAGPEGTATIWDAATGALLLTLPGHDGDMLQAFFTPDGESVLTFATDGTARRWSARDGRLEWTFLGHRDAIWSAHVDAAGELLVTASLDGTDAVWNARQQRHGRALHAPGSVLMHASVAPDRERIATIDVGGSIRIWDGRGGIAATMEASYRETTFPHRVSWSPDGDRLLSSGGPRAMVWDARTGERLFEIEHGEWLLRATWARDGARIATAGKDGSAKLWDGRTSALLQTLTGHEKHVAMAELDPAGRQVLTTGFDQSARLWDAATGAPLRTMSEHTMQVLSGRFSPDGTRLITASSDTTARIFTASGEPLQLLEGHDGVVYDAVLSADGRLAATASADGTAVVWDAATGTALWTVDRGDTAVHSVEIEPDGRFLLLAAGDTAELLDITLDHTPAEALAVFSMCRVGYVVEQGQLARVDVDPVICASQR